MLDKIALSIIIISAILWGAIGLFEIDILSEIFGAGSIVIRIIYSIIAIAGLWCSSLFFKKNEII